MANTGTVECRDCPEVHIAEFHHLAADGTTRVFAVVCDWLIEMYTEEVVTLDA